MLLLTVVSGDTAKASQTMKQRQNLAQTTDDDSSWSPAARAVGMDGVAA